MTISASFRTAALREWAFNVGEDRPNSQWLLTDYDSWERNPHYRGPDQGHPDDYQEPFTVPFKQAKAKALELAKKLSRSVRIVRCGAGWMVLE